MRSKTMTAIVAVLGFVLLSAQGCPGKQSDITPGGACSQTGSKHTNSNGYAYTCRQVPGGNRVWQQDAPLSPDRP